MDGSSKMYSTPIKPEPICVARRIRCASPPERVADERFSVMYSSPTSTRNSSRAMISFKIGLDMAVCCVPNETDSRYALHFRIGRHVISKIFRFPTVTERLSLFSLAPLHTVHGWTVIYLSLIHI